MSDRRSALSQAMFLARITIWYNIVEGVISVWFGIDDGTFALFGFGVDSFVEVTSGLGIWHMVRRMQRDGGEGCEDAFERTALRVTGVSFYLLAAGLAATAAVNVIAGHRPETTFWGVVVSIVSLAVMWALIRAKLAVASVLDSDALRADAACTRACMQLSVVLLVASLGFELTGIGGLDAAGTAVIAWFAAHEGREALEKSQGRL